MTLKFDPRVVPAPRVELVRSIQRQSACRLAGGAALSGVHLKHRLSQDLDLFFEKLEDLRDTVRILPEIATPAIPLSVVRDAKSHVRIASTGFTVDFVYEPMAPIDPPERTDEGVLVDSLTDLRASKLACLLERSEPRDLVDVCFIERAGYSTENGMPAAARKDAGLDPGTLAWLLRTFPIDPLPEMLEPFTVDELRAFRDGLAERMRKLTTG